MQFNSINSQASFFQKVRNFDYILIFCILTLGIISTLSMYSTDGGEILFHTKSHMSKFIIFFCMMIVLSFLNIKFWYNISYLFYILIRNMMIKNF